MTRVEVPRPSLAGILAVMGGAIVALGSVLGWAKAATAGTFTASARGLNGWEGKVTLIAGGILIFVGVATMAGAGPARLRFPAALAGAVTVGVAVYTAITARDQVIEGAAEQISRSLGLPLAQSRDAVRQTVESGALTISLEVGLYLVLIGGMLGLVAALLAFRRPRPVGGPGWPAPPATAPTSPESGPFPPGGPSGGSPQVGPEDLPPAPPPALPAPPPRPEAEDRHPLTARDPTHPDEEGGEGGP